MENLARDLYKDLSNIEKQDIEYKLFRSCEDGDVDNIRRLLHMGIKRSQSKKAMKIATENGHDKVLELFRKLGFK